MPNRVVITHFSSFITVYRNIGHYISSIKHLNLQNQLVIILYTHC